MTAASSNHSGKALSSQGIKGTNPVRKSLEGDFIALLSFMLTIALANIQRRSTRQQAARKSILCVPTEGIHSYRTLLQYYTILC